MNALSTLMNAFSTPLQVDKFLETEQTDLKPLPFLSSWVKHKKLLADKFYAVPFENSDVRVKADIKLVGKVTQRGF